MCTRRFLIALVPAALIRAAADDEIRDLLALIASALAEADLRRVFDQFDPDMPELPTLRAHLEALTTQANVLSSIVVVESVEEEGACRADLDWVMEIRSKNVTGFIEQRRALVKCAFRKVKRKWRIVGLSPVSFFAPVSRAAGAPRQAPRNPAA
jgi:hypothetical protein